MTDVMGLASNTRGLPNDKIDRRAGNNFTTVAT
jgi:hypothetical protein